MSDLAQRREEEKERRRSDIIDAAEALYADKGWDAVTMDMVARSARLSRALLYVYFTDRNDLHLGIVARGGVLDKLGRQPARVDNNLMRPIYLDTIARAFPELQIIGAHLGNPWFEEAAMACRWNPNLYFDLSGSLLKRKKPDFLADLLWWGGNTYPAYRDAMGREAWDKIVFGSDVIVGDIPDVMNDYSKVVEGLNLSQETAEAIFYRTAAQILRWAGIKCD